MLFAVWLATMRRRFKEVEKDDEHQRRLAAQEVDQETLDLHRAVNKTDEPLLPQK